MTESLRIAVVGAGIAGLTFASTLRNAGGVEIRLYEATNQLAEFGAGLSLFPRTWAALAQLGLEDALCEALKYRPSDEPKMLFEVRKGQEPNGGFIDRIMLKGGMRNFHRHAVQRILSNSIKNSKSITIHFSHRLVSLTEQPDCITLKFENGQTADCDLLVGADGIKSVVRKANHQWFGRNVADPVWIGRYGFRGLVNAERLREIVPEHRALSTTLMYVGKNAHIVMYPISNNTLVNVVAYSSIPGKEGTSLTEPPFKESTTEEMLRYYDGWDSEVLTVLKCVEKPQRWAIQALNPLDTYSSGRIALMGDAAHCMAPHVGAGAGQAMEDAWILGTLISSIPCTRENVHQVLGRYSEIRQPYANKIMRDASAQGRVHELSAAGYEAKDHFSDEEYERLGDLIKERLTWGEDPGSLLVDAQRATRLVD